MSATNLTSSPSITSISLLTFFLFFFLRIRPPPRSTLFPSTPLSRSRLARLGLRTAIPRANRPPPQRRHCAARRDQPRQCSRSGRADRLARERPRDERRPTASQGQDRKSTRLNSSPGYISYAAFCLIK